MLDQPEIKSFLKKPYKVVTKVKVPYTGGSDMAGHTYFLDPDLPEKYRMSVLWHERTEKAFRSVLKMPYAHAHDLATAAEHMMVTAKGWDWNEYKRGVGEVVRENEKEAPHKMPRGFDLGPYKESGQERLVKGS